MGFMNEHQLVLAETTFGGREGLHNPLGLIDCMRMMNLALQRARTAREAIQVMTRLAARVWLRRRRRIVLHRRQPGGLDPGDGGNRPRGQGGGLGRDAASPTARSPAMPIPRGSANSPATTRPIASSRTTWRASPAARAGTTRKSGQPFRFCEAYAPETPIMRRICDTRVWSILRRAAPSKHLSPDYHRCKPGRSPIRSRCRPTPSSRRPMSSR